MLSGVADSFVGNADSRKYECSIGKKTFQTRREDEPLFRCCLRGFGSIENADRPSSLVVLSQNLTVHG